MIFNTVVICQISIEFGVRKTGIVDHPLKWITANSVFLGRVGIILVIQLNIIEFLGKAFFIVRLDWKEWQFSLTLGIVEFLFIVTAPLPDARWYWLSGQEIKKKKKGCCLHCFYS